MKSITSLFAVVMLSPSLFATLPEVAITSFRQVGDQVSVEYTLSAPAIVTVDFLANGVSIGEKNFANVQGDVNKYVDKTSGRITWNPVESWPGQDPVPNVRAKVTAWQKETPPDYFVFNMATLEQKYYVSTNALPFGGLENDCYKTNFIVMRKIPAANVEWTMGSGYNEIGHGHDETPHRVRLTQDYYMAIYETTQAQYAYYGDNYIKTFAYNGEDAALHPAEQLACWHVRGTNISTPGYYIGNMRNRGANFELPTEAQWEFACRAGHDTALGNGKEVSSISGDANCNQMAWDCDNNGSLYSHVVGLKEPNSWGLYDMHGNVNEWCRDFYGDYPTESVVDPTGPGSDVTGKGNVNRGGGIGYSHSNGCRSAARSASGAAGPTRDRGFRMICTIPVN